ncbi:putative membrane-bound acyltransferase YfiQ [Lentibacillus sp. JNUCC-1]|uniref:acyltransferase family protein n=1 Tax=Lentibacillus sp. JNUCC-1 TaxID=2654513 RepID=UPI0012E8043E|nr:acyltransferase family protein [Lentibacillus sp. JNUCC-1]MUV36901.1 putative membrane-bound acyltransferase YfiQ [Lentibacillus sp. JNUCC-1]
MKILILPYLFMSVVYALLNAETWTVKEVLFQIAGSIFLGKSAVYFILIIFQFYLLHIFCARYLSQWSGKVVIPVAFVINAGYLAFFNFTDAPSHAVGDYFWNVGYWMPFVGWLFYFVLGFYGGKNYEAIVAMLRSKWILIIPGIALAGMLLMNKYFMISPDSKRVDMLLYACSVIFSIMFIGIRFQRVPRFIMLISNYSFSIFLLNMFFFVLISYVEPPVFLNIATYSISAFIITLVLCIGTTYVFNQFRFGKYFVGAVMPFKVAHTERYDEVTLRRGLK